MSGVLTMGSLDPAFAAATSVHGEPVVVDLRTVEFVEPAGSAPRSATGVPERAQRGGGSCTRRTRRASLSGADELLQVVRG